MQQILVDPVFTFPNFHRGQNTCHLTVAVNADLSRVLIVAAQRHDEWYQGTSAINNAEGIAQRVMTDVMPKLQQQYPKLRQAEIIWVIEVITGDDSLYNVRTLVEFSWKNSPWPRRWLQPFDYSQRPGIDFGRKLQPSEYVSLLG